MTRYVNVTVKIVREFGDDERTTWGGRYLGVYGEIGNERHIIFDEDDIVGEFGLSIVEELFPLQTLFSKGATS